MTARSSFILRICAFIFCLAGFDQAGGQEMRFNHLKAENGLVNNSVLAIAQDSHGFMWFGTRLGLSRYDGVGFKTYKTRRNDSTSLSHNYVQSLFVDSKGTLWVGNGVGLDKYNHSRDAFERISLVQNRRVVIHCIYEDRKGDLWVGSSGGLHLLTDRGRSLFQTFKSEPGGIPGNTVRAIYEDWFGNLWIGTNNGLAKMTRKNGQFAFETFQHEPGKTGTLSANYITTIAEDGGNGLWIGTQHDGINLYDPTTNSFTKFVRRQDDKAGIINNNIRKIFYTKSGELWIGTQEGLSIMDPGTKSIRSYQHDTRQKGSLSQNSIYSIFQDASGSIWVGTYFGGANVKYSASTNFTIYQHHDDRSSLSNNVVSSIIEDENRDLWIGTEGGGLNYYERSRGEFRAFKNKLGDPESLGSNLVKVVYLDRDGNPWVGTHGGGLNVLDRENGTFKRYLNDKNDPAALTREVTSILEDHSSRFWVATYLDLRLFRRDKTLLEPVDIRSELPSYSHINALNLFEDSQQNIWVAGRPGLYVMKGNEIKTIDSSNDFNCMYEDSKGTIWIGLAYGGLASYDASNDTLRRYNLKLINNNVVGILDDAGGNLWLSTDNGLVRFNPESGHLQTYTESDGLAGDEFNFNSYVRDSNGELFFGGFNGITSFFTHNIETNRYAAPMAITGLKLFNKEVEIGGEDKLLSQSITLTEEVTFNHEQDVFSVEFALLNFIKSDKNKYAYKLEGFDKEWNEVTNTSATYTSLPAGSYTFLVKGTNNDGIESEPASLMIKILPPFWLTWWAYSVYVIVISAIMFLLLRYMFLRALVKKEDELHQAKLNFFTNISHEIRTHLTLILAPVDQLIEQKEKGGFDHQQLTSVKNYANRLLKLVNELMDFRKAETRHLKLSVTKGDLIAFLQDIYTSFQGLSIEKNIRTSFTHDSESVGLYFDQEQLEKVFFNLLTNAFKFTPSGGTVGLHVEEHDESVVVYVTDNGRGIADGYIDKLFDNFFQVADEGHRNTGYGIGLALSKGIVELHKGTITAESEVAAGGKAGRTVFTVTLLKGIKHFEGAGFFVSHEEAERKNVSPRATEATAPPPRLAEATDKQFTILVVEDNAELRRLAYETFVDQYHVLLSEDGLKGWEKACEEIPDVIISDVMMPGMNGFSLCNKLKTDERTSHIPVILLTAKSSQTDLVSGLETGADVYLTKPFSPKALALNVRNLLASTEKIRQRFSRQITADCDHQMSPAIEVVRENFDNSVDVEFLNKVIRLVEENIENPDFGVEMLSREVGMSVPILYKKIKAVADMSVNEFVKSLRLKKAARLLLQKKQTVYEVAYAVGYSDRKYFSKEFKKHYGKTPSEYAG